MVTRYKKVVKYKPLISPSFILEYIPFWWFTDIGIRFAKGKRSQAVVYAVHEDALISRRNDFGIFPDMKTTLDHVICYDPEKYPDEANTFQNFPPKRGKSPLARGVEILMGAREFSWGDIDKIQALLRWCRAYDRRIFDVIELSYEHNRKETKFERRINHPDRIDYPEAIVYLDGVFKKASK